MHKSYEQMKKEFIEFYQNYIKEELPKYNTNRHNATFKLVFTLFIHIFWLLTMGLPILSTLMGPIDGFIFMALAFLLMPVLFVCGIIYTFVINGDIKHNQEMELKVPFMLKLMRIFLDYTSWTKYSPTNISGGLHGLHQWNIRNDYALLIPNSVFNDIENSKSKLEEIKSQNIINNFMLALFDDIIFGEYNNVKIAIYETNTNIITSKLFLPFLSTIIIPISILIIIPILGPLIIFFLLVISWFYLIKHKFNGIVIEFDMNKNFNGHTFFHENSPTAKRIRFDKNKYKKLNLESVTFEKKYNAYSDDQIEGRYLLTPAFMDRIENLRFTFKAKYVRGSFRNNKLTLAIHTDKDMFAMGYDFKDSDYKTFEELYYEIVSILQIVDELKLNEHTGL